MGEEGRRDPGPLRGLAELQLRRHRPAGLHPLPGRAAAGGRGAGLLLGEGSKGRWAPTPPGPPSSGVTRHISPDLGENPPRGTATGGSDSFRERDGAEESLRNPPLSPCSHGPSPGPPHGRQPFSGHPMPVLPLPAVTGWHSLGWGCPSPSPSGSYLLQGAELAAQVRGSGPVVPCSGNTQGWCRCTPKVPVWEAINNTGQEGRLEWPSSPGEGRAQRH